MATELTEKDKEILKEMYDREIAKFNGRRVITPKMRYVICAEQRWRCNVCFAKIKYSGDKTFEAETAHIDHIHPFADANSYINGSDNIDERNNLQALCGTCNLKKGRNKS